MSVKKTRMMASQSALLLAMTCLWASTSTAQDSSPLPSEDSLGSYGAQELGQPIIQFDPETGSLIIIADEETNRHISEIVASLDRPVPQVLIKVLFLEITHNKGIDYGVDSQFRGPATAPASAGVGNKAVETILGSASALAQAQPFGSFFSFAIGDFAGLINAVSEVGTLEVLSRPSVLVRHNQQATITIGQEVPFVRNTRVSDTGQIINTIEYEDIGIILDVTPRVTADGWVDMQVAPEISTILPEDQSIAISETTTAPVFAKRSANTRVVVPSGQTVVIGGLMQDNISETTRKTPILGSIPLIGLAFRHKEKSNEKTELLMFLTPYVVSTGRELRDISMVEKNKSKLIPEVFTEEQMDRYLDDLSRNDADTASLDTDATNDASVEEEPVSKRRERRRLFRRKK